MKCSVRLVSNPDSKKNYLGHTVLVHNLLYSCIDAGGHSYRYSCIVIMSVILIALEVSE